MTNAEIITATRKFQAKARREGRKDDVAYATGALHALLGKKAACPKVHLLNLRCYLQGWTKAHGI